MVYMHTNLDISLSQCFCLASQHHIKVAFASLNHNIYIAADPASVDVDHAAHAGGHWAHNVYSANHDNPPTLIILLYST